MSRFNSVIVIDLKSMSMSIRMSFRKYLPFCLSIIVAHAPQDHAGFSFLWAWPLHCFFLKYLTCHNNGCYWSWTFVYAHVFSSDCGVRIHNQIVQLSLLGWIWIQISFAPCRIEVWSVPVDRFRTRFAGLHRYGCWLHACCAGRVHVFVDREVTHVSEVSRWSNLKTAWSPLDLSCVRDVVRDVIRLLNQSISWLTWREGDFVLWEQRGEVGFYLLLPSALLVGHALEETVCLCLSVHNTFRVVVVEGKSFCQSFLYIPLRHRICLLEELDLLFVCSLFLIWTLCLALALWLLYSFDWIESQTIESCVAAREAVFDQIVSLWLPIEWNSNLI